MAVPGPTWRAARVWLWGQRRRMPLRPAPEHWGNVSGGLWGRQGTVWQQGRPPDSPASPASSLNQDPELSYIDILCLFLISKRTVKKNIIQNLIQEIYATLLKTALSNSISVYVILLVCLFRRHSWTGWSFIRISWSHKADTAQRWKGQWRHLQPAKSQCAPVQVTKRSTRLYVARSPSDSGK